MTAFIKTNAIPSQQFHVDQPSWCAEIIQSLTSQRVVTVQLDGDELEAFYAFMLRGMR